MAKQVKGSVQATRMSKAIGDQQEPGHGSGSVFKGPGKSNEPDNLPRVGKKSYKDITATSVIELPKNEVKPVFGRIFCIAQDPGEMKTGGGIILPNTHNAPEAKGGRKRELMRYWVVDVADDCKVTVPVARKSEERRKLERGDEVYPFIPQEAEEWTFPTVFDFYLNQEYLVIHETELAGVGMSPALKKEDD